MTASVVQSLKRRKRKHIGFKQEGSTENFSQKQEDANSSENPGGVGEPRTSHFRFSSNSCNRAPGKKKRISTLYYYSLHIYNSIH